MWFRRDLRLEDNPAWAAATSAHDQVVALFVLEPALMEAAGDIRRDQLIAHLRALDDHLRAAGGCLVLRYGPATAAVTSIVDECGASAVYVNSDASGFSGRRDAAVADALSVPVHSSGGLTIHEPGTVLTKKGTLSQVFTPFYKTWLATPLAPWPAAGAGRPIELPGERIPEVVGPVRQEPGAVSAWQRLTDWLARVDEYSATRDLPAVDGTSDLSADLKFGTLAARTVAEVVGDATPGRVAFVRQLAWRDWWAHTLTLHPELPVAPLRARYAGVVWLDDPDGFQRWCAGRTGYPIVDAGMRQLTTTGWMHNRARMICASFLVKDLLVDWRQGERFFRHHLVDADVAQNAGNWQWVAGTGPDAAPYFRILNPTTQGQRFDPRGEYIRRWVPELAALPSRSVHDPSSASSDDLADAGVLLGETYPRPVVDHGEARVRAIEAYRRAGG